jgi:hypothetical protein
MKSLDKKQITELLNKSWMTHDAMWFAHCLQECGIETTNRINKAAVRSMGMIEGKRMAKAFGVEKIETFEHFKEFFNAAKEVVMPDFMEIDLSFPKEGVIHAQWRNCFAHEGLERLGFIDQYECGIFERINAWLETLGIKYTVSPEVKGCMMCSTGSCYRDYKLTLP